MNSLGGLFEKFSRLINSGKALKENIRTIIKQKTNIELTNEDLDVKDGVLYIHQSPVVRSEIFMRKKQILEEIKALKIIDIR